MAPFSSWTRRCNGDQATARLVISSTAEAVSLAAARDYWYNDGTVAGRVITGFIEIGCTVAMDYVTGLMCADTRSAASRVFPRLVDETVCQS